MLADCSAKVAAFDIRQADVEETVGLICNAGGRSVAIAGDATDGTTVDRAVSATESELGAITLLANVAGGSVTWSPTWEADRDAWWDDVELNLKSAFLFCHRILPGMVERGAGRIVNTASAAATAKWESRTWLPSFSPRAFACFRFTRAAYVHGPTVSPLCRSGWTKQCSKPC
jgi:NAD(P)-dependent dehydrogenase (short-subunit alcohol dehydrogenase family)